MALLRLVKRTFKMFTWCVGSLSLSHIIISRPFEDKKKSTGDFSVSWFHVTNAWIWWIFKMKRNQNTDLNWQFEWCPTSKLPKELPHKRRTKKTTESYQIYRQKKTTSFLKIRYWYLSTYRKKFILWFCLAMHHISFFDTNTHTLVW